MPINPQFSVIIPYSQVTINIIPAIQEFLSIFNNIIQENPGGTVVPPGFFKIKLIFPYIYSSILTGTHGVLWSDRTY